MKKRILVFVLASLATMLVVYIFLRGVGVFLHGYSWGEMDWNGDGITTVIEFFEAIDIGRRDVVVDGNRCVEYFAFKDGLAVRIDCHDEKRRSQLNK